ncbi:hypothetical protein MKW94_022405 [Papaver nudicaule]|uniref:Uncharacterized protein n=1 Tax=Papaver nudicaule TaxID=74823 RepID=A0AA41V443_PAPNU|nr:hypothetical protein [Papaver nudicaule]
MWASSWEPTPRYSYGFFRIEVLGALATVLIQWIVTGVLVYEAVERITKQNAIHEIKGWVMVLLSSISVLVNIFLVILFHRHHESQGHTVNINTESAYLHALGDSLLSIGVLIGGLVIWIQPKWKIVDLICTFIFSLLVLKTTLAMVRKLFGVLMECAPRGVDPTAVANSLAGIHEVVAVEDLHIWSITAEKVFLTSHVKVNPESNPYTVLDQVIQHIRQEYKINDVTIQIEV